MPLYEYACRNCKKRFEEIASSDPKSQEELACPSCGSHDLEKLISRFAVAGQGDLRESTVHGCHGCHAGHKHGSGNPSGNDGA